MRDYLAGVKSGCSMLNEPRSTRPRLACPEESKWYVVCLHRISTDKSAFIGFRQIKSAFIGFRQIEM